MILAYHIIITTYGSWLPNDPRGSWSDFVAAWELLHFGKATTVRTKRSLAHDHHNHKTRIDAKKKLKYPAVTLNGQQARSIAQGFAKYLSKKKLTATACAILPQHTHIVVRKHPEHPAEQMAIDLKSNATRQLKNDNLHPYQEIADQTKAYPKMWARGCWKVYLNSQTALQHAIQYVENNPIREGKKKQSWNFISQE